MVRPLVLVRHNLNIKYTQVLICICFIMMKGHMLSLHSVMSGQLCRLTSLNNFHQCNNASNNLPRKYIDLNNKYVANHFLRSAECFIYLFNALHSLKYIFTSSLENMTLVAILNLHGIVGLILKTENSVCQKEQFNTNSNFFFVPASCATY